MQSTQGLHNTGQSGGTVDADIDALEVWDIQQGSIGSVVGIIDTGIDYRHPDLYQNVWINQGEIPAAIRNSLVDVDGDSLFTFWDLNDPQNWRPDGPVADLNSNGYIDGGDLLNNASGWEDGINNDAATGNIYSDDLIGWDFVNNDNDPWDDHSHGTHVAGTIGAVNNNIGVVGVNWHVQMVGLKFLSGGGSGTTNDAIEAIQYANTVGIDLTNNSWGGGGFSQGLYDAIAAGGLFVAAAGNDGLNTDVSPHYPSSYLLDNILSVLIAKDETSGSITVQVNGDSTIEPDETFTVNLTTQSPNVLVVDGIGIGTIVDDDKPRLSINDVTIIEGDSGTRTARFTVSLLKSHSSDITFDYATALGTTNPATPGVDYASASGTLTFDSASSETVKTIDVTIYGDTEDEPSETFVVNLSNITEGVTLVDGQGIGTIGNDDGQPIQIIDNGEPGFSTTGYWEGWPTWSSRMTCRLRRRFRSETWKPSREARSCLT